MNEYKLNVRVGNYIYTVDVHHYCANKWMACFRNPDIDSFTQSWPVTKKDVVEYIKEEYPEKA